MEDGYGVEHNGQGQASHGAQHRIYVLRRIDPHIRSYAANMPRASNTSIKGPGGRGGVNGNIVGAI